MANEVRLIDANALQEKLDWDNDIQRWTLYGIDDLDEMPTIDPESLRPKGRWEEHDTSRYGAPAYFCSRCYDIWESLQIKNMKYCPSCGAKMEG